MNVFQISLPKCIPFYMLLSKIIGVQIQVIVLQKNTRKST